MEFYRQKIALTSLRFFAHHGFYREEQVLGNEFFLTITCFLSRNMSDDDNLSKAINYEVLYRIAKDQMEKPRKLLETVVANIVENIKAQFPELDEIDACLKKMNPPFGGDTAIAEVSLHWKKGING